MLRSELFPKNQPSWWGFALFSCHPKKLGGSDAIRVDVTTALAISRGEPVLSIPSLPRCCILGVSFLGERGCGDKSPCAASLPPAYIFFPGRGAQGQTPEIRTQPAHPLAGTPGPNLRDLKAKPEINRGHGSLTKSPFSPQPQKKTDTLQEGIPPEQTGTVLLQVFCLNSKLQRPPVNYSSCLTRKRSLRVGNVQMLPFPCRHSPSVASPAEPGNTGGRHRDAA